MHSNFWNISKSRYKWALVLIALSALGTSCSDKKTTEQAPASAVTKEEEKEKNKNEPNQYLADIEKASNKYDEIKLPAKSQLFRFNFSNKKNHLYTFEQKAQVKYKPNIETSLKAKGTLLIKSRGDKTAEVVMKSDVLDIKTNNKSTNNTEQTESPPLVVQGLKEDGTGIFEHSEQDILFRSLFLLPKKPLGVGDFEVIPSQFPFRTSGSVLEVKGHYRIKLVRYVRTGMDVYAQFQVDADISKLQIPPELEGKHTCFLRGKGVFYFDIKKQTFVSGTIAATMQFTTDVPVPHSPDEKHDKIPKNEKLFMSNKSLFQYKKMGSR